MGTQLFECKFCLKTFKEKRILKGHITMTHMGTQYPCDKCELVFGLPISLTKHIHKSHNGPKPYQCSFCSNNFCTKALLNAHKNVVHNIDKQRFKCDKCDKSYLRKNYLTQHRAMHNKRKIHKCQFCSASFKIMEQKRRHERTHFPVNKSVKCNICEKRFAYKDGLQFHIKIVHETGEKLVCVFCEKGFKRQGGLNNHIRHHIQEKDHQCEICFKEFYSYNKKAMHMRVHTGERPFKCSECSESFTNGSNLTRHKRMHAKVLPCQCVFCGKGYTSKYLLRDHILREIRETWYSCKVCNKQFTAKVLLKCHQKVHRLGK